MSRRDQIPAVWNALIAHGTHSTVGRAHLVQCLECLCCPGSAVFVCEWGVGKQMHGEGRLD